jgi:hypothetical protein
MRKESSLPVSSVAMGNEGHRDGELIHEGDIKDINVIQHRHLAQPSIAAELLLRHAEGRTHQRTVTALQWF